MGLPFKKNYSVNIKNDKYKMLEKMCVYRSMSNVRHIFGHQFIPRPPLGHRVLPCQQLFGDARRGICVRKDVVLLRGNTRRCC